MQTKLTDHQKNLELLTNNIKGAKSAVKRKLLLQYQEQERELV